MKAKLREDRRDAATVHEVWAMDFGHDQLATSAKPRILTIVDDFSRSSPAVHARFNSKRANVVETPERVCREAGYPRAIRVDQSSEFVSRDLDL